MTTANIAEVLKLAAKPVQYENDEKTWLEFRFQLVNYHTLVVEKYVCSDHPVAESHTVRLVGDTDHWTKLETGAKSAEQKWVRGVETVGGRERAENRASEIRDAANRATAGAE